MSGIVEDRPVRYVRWTGNDLDLGTGRDGRDLAEEWTEVAPDGHVTREIGLDAEGTVVHLFPSSKYPEGRYGHFDLALVGGSEPDTVDPTEFETRWREAESDAELLALPPSDIDVLAQRVSARLNHPGWSDALGLLTAAVLLVLAVAILGYGALHSVVGR